MSTQTERTRYRTKKLRRLSDALEPYGGIEGRYRVLAGQHRTRREIAEILGLSVHALGYWIRAWNRKE